MAVTISGTDGLVGTISADTINAERINAPTIYDQETELHLGGLDSGTYYPVLIEGGSSGRWNNFSLFRAYYDSYPALGLGFIGANFRFSGYTWGGNVCALYNDHYLVGYRNLLGIAGMRGYYRPVLYLRGGYRYTFRADFPLDLQLLTASRQFRDDQYAYTLGPVPEATITAHGGYLGTTNYSGGWRSTSTSVNNIG